MLGFFLKGTYSIRFGLFSSFKKEWGKFHSKQYTSYEEKVPYPISIKLQGFRQTSLKVILSRSLKHILYLYKTFILKVIYCLDQFYEGLSHSEHIPFMIYTCMTQISKRLRKPLDKGHPRSFGHCHSEHILHKKKFISTGIYLLDQCLLRSFIKGQGHSRYTLHMMKTFLLQRFWTGIDHISQT